MNLTRRTALLGTSALALASCAPGSTTQAQVLADLQGLIPVLQTTLSTIVSTDPAAIPASVVAQVNDLFTAAQNALTDFSASGAASTVESYLNATLSALGAALPAVVTAFPTLAAFVPVYDAAVSLIRTVIEPYLNSLNPGSAIKLPRATPRYTPDEARAILHIK